MTRETRQAAHQSLRGAVSGVFRGAATFAALSAAAMLSWVLVTLAWRGVAALVWVEDIEAVGLGLFNAFFGSLLVVAWAFAMAVPLGLVAGVFLAEVGRSSRWLSVVRVAADVLSGMPAIVVGVCAYLLLSHLGLEQSFVAGAVALGALMMPMVTCATARALSEAPPALREAAVALGTPPWRILLQISLRAAAPGILSAGLLAIAQVAGEVAPLLLTMPAPSSWSLSAGDPMATLHVEAYRYLLSPDPQTQSLAWTAALLLTLGVASIVLLSHRFGRRAR